jgi:hypothetical protein
VTRSSGATIRLGSWAGAGPIPGWVAPTPAPTPTRWARSRIGLRAELTAGRSWPPGRRGARLVASRRCPGGAGGSGIVPGDLVVPAMPGGGPSGVNRVSPEPFGGGARPSP